jgi:SAM-dependent methyltransferase
LNKSISDSWYKQWFNTQDYLDLYRNRDEVDASKIIRLILDNIKLQKGAEVLDLACGSGRHSVLFAKKGFHVTGIDLSPFLIRKANERLKKEYSGSRRKLKFEVGDMKRIYHKNEFDLVVNVFTSFGYFEKDKNNRKVIRSVANALKPGGWFLIDFLNKRYLHKNIVPFDIKKERGKIIIQIRSITNLFVEKNILIIKNNRSNDSYPVMNRFKEKIRLYSFDDFKLMFTASGLKIKNTFGNYSGAKYNKQKSERLIILARKV